MFTIKNLCLTLSVLVLSFLVGYSVLSWTGPTGTAPTSNVAAPINVSSTAQTKSGNLSVPILYDADNTNYYINPSGSSVLSGNLSSGTITLTPSAAPTCDTNAKGKLYYDSTQNKSYYCNGASWTEMGGGSGSSQWTTSGNNIYYTTGNVGIGATSPQTALDLGYGTAGRSISWSGGDGSAWYSTIGSRYSSADLNILSGLKLSTSADQILYSYTGTYGPSGIGLDLSAGDILFFNQAIGAKTVGNVFDYATNTKMIVKSSGYVGIGTTTPSDLLHVQGDATITGKLTLGTLDPQYTIDGTDYATYGASVAGGVKEETMGVIQIQKSKCKSQNENQELKICEYTIDFSKQERGSDLWLFSKVTDFGKNMEYLVINLTAGGDFCTWYEKIPSENKLIIYAKKEGEVSYRLIANRHDWKDWPNIVKD